MEAKQNNAEQRRVKQNGVRRMKRSAENSRSSETELV